MNYPLGLDEELWNGERSICMFVHRNKTYWVIDYKYNFTLDAEADYKAYLDKGHITKDQYLEACKNFRNGILKLSAENFLQYLKLDSVILTNAEELKDYLLSGFLTDEIDTLYRKVESFLVYGSKLCPNDFKRANQLVCKLPLFYINFDKKSYMHMDWDRYHETLVPSDWHAEARDFGNSILDSDVYWQTNSYNFWHFRKVAGS
ncbi:hypothetical protein AB835_13450 [Candidatus Endobugula sertula]|uniref:Uncharacterized protein n=1 Tax=Candidatus Endobugula sertula TaxID=62101 RepID=A0A1D2QLY2_9GAMM|nr:hypothetical protein AB835_13450 [Candidatus Endobugula sertula]